eukprot:3988672-Amphidinium_carterae.2
MTQQQIQRVLHPLRFGGLGLTFAINMREAARVSSWMKCFPGILNRCPMANVEQCSQAVPHFTSILNMVKRAHPVVHNNDVQAPAAPTMPNLTTQQTLTHRYLTSGIKQWDDSVDSQTRAWRHSCSGTGAGAWLMAPTHPSDLMETQMFTQAVHLRLGPAVETNGNTCHHQDVAGRTC